MLPKMSEEKSNVKKWSRFFPSKSITGRLIAFYVVSITGILAIALFLLFHDITQNLEAQDYHFLINKIEVARSELKSAADPREQLDEEVVLESRAMQFARYYTRIEHRNFSTVIESSEFAKIFKSAPFPTPVDIDQVPKAGVRWNAPNGKWYLLMSAWAEDHQQHNRTYVIRIALDVSHEHVVIGEYKKEMILVLLGGFFFATILGTVITRKGLEPLHDIAKVIKTVSSNRLHERIGTHEWPDELVVLSKSFDNMLFRLEDSFNRLRQFSADLAHELRTPIHNVMGQTEVALSRIRSADDYRGVLESNMEEYRRLMTMIEQLLFLARADRTELHIMKKKFEVRKEMERVVTIYEPLYEEKNIRLRLSGDGLLNADPVLFQRAVNNLLSNAVRYTPEFGSITLIAESYSDYTDLIVSDTGNGIPTEQIAKVFDRFYRVDKARSDGRDGSGLGLSIVKTIMELHEGDVFISSEPDNGTKVTLRFPN